MSNSKDIDDVDDDTFISKKPQKYIFAEKKANDLTERTNKMMTNVKTILQETEQVGQSALENLLVQRETLERVEDDLDHINTVTRSTQKHLNNMKSFFGGIKSLFSSSNSASVTGQPVAPADIKRGMPRSATLANVPSNVPANTFAPRGSSSDTGAQIVKAGATQEAEPDEYQANLSEIGFGLDRLKEMAVKMGDELGDQNELMDRITSKSERAGDSVKHQNRQMAQILKKG